MRTHILMLGALLAATACKEKDAGVDTSDGGTVTDTDDTDTVDTDTEDTDTVDTDTTPVDPECWTDGDYGECYDTTTCPLPTTPSADSLAFLNQCSDVDAVVFDNAARIPASTWTPGTPLPPIP